MSGIWSFLGKPRIWDDGWGAGPPGVYLHVEIRNLLEENSSGIKRTNFAQMYGLSHESGRLAVRREQCLNLIYSLDTKPLVQS